MVKKTNQGGRVLFFIVGLVFVLSTLIKLFYVWGNNFAFTPDQGRDLIDIRQMVVTHTPRLVGPTTSINGVLLGPFYYYFISIPFIFFGGNPMGIVIWQIAWFQISTIFIWYVLRKKDLVLASTAAILLLLSPVGFATGRYFWNANVMPIFTIIFFATLIWVLTPDTSLRGAERRGNLYKLFILGLVAGLSLQIEAAFGLLFFPFAFLILLSKKFSFRDLGKYSLVFGLTLLPQVLFELRHGFIMTKTLFAGLLGKSGDLGEKLSFFVRLSERKDVLLTAIRDSNHLSFEILGSLFGVIILLGLYNFVRDKVSKPGNTLFLVSLFFMIFAIIFYLVFPQHIKNWYVFGLSIPIILIISGVLTDLYYSSRAGILILWLFVIFSLYHTLLAHSRYLYEYALLPSSDPSNMATELKTVDLVYALAGGQAFKVYSYLPSIYDYTYQYLFWWYGTEKYGYQPSDISYLPGQPEYIKNNNNYWLKKGTAPGLSTFLIIQNDPDHPDRLIKWRSNFANLCLQKTVDISDRLFIEELSSCSK